VFIIFFLTQSGGSSEEYVKEIDQYWEDKHNFYRTSQASPFVEKGVAYKEVQYFDPNPDYKIIGELERLSKRETLVLGNSDGTTTTYLKFANIHFKFKGQKHSLLLLKALGFGNQYLLAFGDGTSGVLTYGGGKYLDVSVGKSDQIELDFNKSYNPYCAYFDDFTCPLPPIENLLDIRIEAGEKYVE
ncbi:MAG: DUF1684 domain-containing protein, partial [Ekhidna sp.]